MSNVLVLGEALVRKYVVVAHRKGEWRPLTKYFPILESSDEAMQHVMAKAAADPAWAAKYRGWAFCSAEWSNSVIIGNDGIVRRCS